MKKPIFINEALQKQFEEVGYVKISLLTLNDVEKLKALFAGYFPNPSIDFFSTSYLDDYDFKKEVSNEILKIISPRLENFLSNYFYIGAAFLSKGNGPRSQVPMHQDWTIVDEALYDAVNIWTPLVPTNELNGTIEVIKGSHKWNNIVRCPTLPFYYLGYEEQLTKMLTVIRAFPGDAVILNQAIIHYSKANSTQEIRTAITTGVRSKDTNLIFHYWDKNKPDVIERFEQDNDFLLKFTEFHKSIFERPTFGKSLGTMPFTLPKVSQKEVNELMGVKPESKESFRSKLLQWVKG